MSVSVCMWVHVRVCVCVGGGGGGIASVCVCVCVCVCVEGGGGVPVFASLFCACAFNSCNHIITLLLTHITAVTVFITSSNSPFKNPIHDS